MDTLFDYLKWRGDLALSDLPLSIEDQLILATLVYVNYSGYVAPDETLSVRDASLRILSHGYKESDYRVKNDYRLLQEIVDAPRFSSLMLSDCVEHFDESSDRQFFAFTVHLPSSIIICYRGTDLSLAGWKEDFNMAFSDTVPAQKDALDYLVRVADRYRTPIMLCGHSKGGNLAVFAAANAPVKIRRRIVRVYNNDGPGFNEGSSTHALLPAIEDKVETLVPSSSVIGMLMEHTMDYRIVESSSFLIFQHDPYSWLFDGPHFKYSDSRSLDSLVADKVASDWLSSITPEEREKFVDVLFTLFGKAGIRSFRGYSKQMFLKAPEFLKAFLMLPKDQKSMFIHVVNNLFKAFAGSLFHRGEEQEAIEFSDNDFLPQV